MMGYGIGTDGLNYPVSKKAMDLLKISRADFKDIIVRVESSAKEFESIFSENIGE